MKLNKFFMGLLGFGALAMTACSSEEPVSGGDNSQPGEGETRYMSVSIRNSNSGTRAGGDQTADGDKTFEEGYAGENSVKSLRFYFFKADGSPAPVTFGGSNYYDCKKEEIVPGNPDINMPNVEEILQAVVVINTNTNEGSRNDIKQMVALVNFKGVDSRITGDNKDANLSLADLTGIVNSESSAINEDGFLMTSSSFYFDSTEDADKYKGLAAQIKDSDIKATKELAQANPVDVYVERVVAKVRVTEAWEDMNEVDDVTMEGVAGTFTAVPLKDKQGTPILSGNNADDSQVYVIFQNWDLWWTADKTNLFKKVGNWDSALAWAWNHPEYNRSYWAENPERVKLQNFAHDKANRAFGKGTKDNYSSYTAYCLENAADFNNGGLKKGYDPDGELTNRTLVYLKAMLVTLDGKKATPLELAEWAGYKYTKANVLTAMFEPNVNEFYFIDRTDTTNEPVVNEDGSVIIGGTSSWKAVALRDSDVRLVTGLEAGVAGNDVENSPRYQSFVNLAQKDAYYTGEKQLYRKVVANGENKYIPVSADEVNDQLESVGGAKVWEGGNTYYFHEISHLGKTGVDDEGNAFNYGVVRNHIYDVELTSVTGLGTPVLQYVDDEGNTKWEDIIPQKPTPDAYFLGARLNILSWRVVGNKATLDW